MTEEDRDEFDEEFASSPWETVSLLVICAVALPFDILKNLWFLATGQNQKYQHLFDDLRVPPSGHFSPH